MCSVPPKEICVDMNRTVSNGGGWIQGLYSMCVNLKEVELSICFPLDNSKSIISGRVGDINYYTFYQKANVVGVSDLVTLNRKTLSDMKSIIEFVKPDILHIFGSENAYALAAFNVFDNPRRTIIHIQGLVSVIAKSYEAGLPQRVIRMVVPSTIVRGTIYRQKKMMMLRGINEIELLRRSENVMGRTEWDRAHCTDINCSINYYFCNEILRKSFYIANAWNYNDCVKHTIFMSQGSYPLKGLHVAIEALKIIKRHFPDVMLNVAGNNPVKENSFKGMVSRSSYGVYIRSLIKEYSLEENIRFIGSLDEEGIVGALQETNAYLMSSYMENSPNSLAEAMILGVPCVASDVGGVSSMMKCDKEGYIYQHDDPVMLAYQMMKVFDNSEEVRFACGNARKRAMHDHSIKNVRKELLYTYGEVLSR